MSFSDIWKKITESPSYRPARINIPANHVDIGAKLQTPFVKNENYFVVRINELFLSYSRKWFSTYDPVVFATTEFIYNAEKFAVPFVVGPTIPRAVRVHPNHRDAFLSRARSKRCVIDYDRR